MFLSMTTYLRSKLSRETLSGKAWTHLSVCFRWCVLSACHSWCDICSFCSSFALTHVQSGTANQPFRSFSGFWLSRHLPFFHPVFVSWFLLMCLYWMALLFNAIYSICQPHWLPNFPSLICLLEAPYFDRFERWNLGSVLTSRSRSFYEKQCIISSQRCLDATIICY